MTQDSYLDVTNPIQLFPDGLVKLARATHVSTIRDNLDSTFLHDDFFFYGFSVDLIFMPKC